MGKLTDVQLRAWVRAGEPITGKSDGGGLTFTLSTKGVASWVLRYRIAGKQRELTLGRYDDIGIADARKLATTKRAEVQQVIDVAAVKQRLKIEIKQAVTVAELAELWLDHAIRPKHKHPRVTEGVIRRDVIPALGKLPPKEVTQADISRLLDKIKADGRPTIANDVLRYLRLIFKYGEKHEYVESNPTSLLDKDDAGGKETARVRALTRNEIAKLFKVMREAGAGFARENELCVKLLLVMGCRKMELIGSQWAEFDLDAGVWLIPASRVKTDKSRELPLPAAVIGWLNELKVRACGSAYVFPARRAGIRFAHVSPDTLNAALHGLEHGLEAFTVHDLRRTSRSLMSDIGIAFDVAEKILGHDLPGTAAIYDRGNSLERQRSALEKLASLIVELDTGRADTNVIPMNRGAAA